jgi:tRNA(Ile)-lysidine synthase
VEEVAKKVPDGSGIVAVSGGPDSVALLRALHELGKPVTVAHVNHQLRGEESDGDEAFVANLAEQLKQHFCSTRITLPLDVTSLEAVARAERYCWMNTLSGDWIATGHTADDQAETVLFHIIRGTGIAGLRGIQSHQSGWSNKGFLPRIRPLLELTRVDVLDYLQSIDQTFRIDSSNKDSRFTRNRIRHEVMPLLKTFNPNVVAAVNLLAKLAGEANAAIELEARKLLRQVELPRAGQCIVLNPRPFQLNDDQAPLYHRNLIREMFRHIWNENHWPSQRMNFDHWNRLAAWIAGGGGDFDLPDGISARRVGRVVQLGPRS